MLPASKQRQTRLSVLDGLVDIRPGILKMLASYLLVSNHITLSIPDIVLGFYVKNLSFNTSQPGVSKCKTETFENFFYNYMIQEDPFNIRGGVMVLDYSLR